MKKKGIWRNGYNDGSGKGTITFDEKPVLRVHWGCSCCDYFNSDNPTQEDKKLIRFADEITNLLNEKKVRMKC